MKCPMCRHDYDGVELLPGEWNDPTDEWCPKCISDAYETDMIRMRAKRIKYHKELVTVGKGEFECSGYWLSGSLYDQEITCNGQDVYGLLDVYVQDAIEVELMRRIESEKLVRRCIAIEKELPDSDDPAALRLERSEIDEKLEKLEALA